MEKFEVQPSQAYGVYGGDIYDAWIVVGKNGHSAIQLCDILDPESVVIENLGETTASEGLLLYSWSSSG